MSYVVIRIYFIYLKAHLRYFVCFFTFEMNTQLHLCESDVLYTKCFTSSNKKKSLISRDFGYVKLPYSSQPFCTQQKLLEKTTLSDVSSTSRFEEREVKRRLFRSVKRNAFTSKFS